MSYEQFREQCADAGDLLRSPMKGTLSHEAIAFNEGFDAAVKGFQASIRAMALTEDELQTRHFENGDEIITSLYKRFKEWSKRGFSADDVTWCEVRAEVYSLINLPLPEVTWSPKAWMHPISHAVVRHDIKVIGVTLDDFNVPLYDFPPDAEALRKENEQLRSLLESAANGLRWYQDHHPEDGSEADYEMLEQIDIALKGGA